MTYLRRFFGLFLIFLVTFSLAGCTSEFIVEFDTDGGDYIEPVTVTGKEGLTKPEEPEKEGFLFIGWYADSNLSQEFDFDTPITEDITLYVKWEEITYELRFEDAEGELILSLEFHEGDSLVDVEYPEDPEYPDATFLGWDEELPATMPNHDIVITAMILEFTGIEIAFCTDIGGIEDPTGINADIWNAIQMFGDFNEKTYAYYQPLEASLDSYEMVIELAIVMGAEIVICPSYVYEVAVYELQDIYPDVEFLLLDGTPHNENYTDYEITDNTAAITFDVYQAGFLAGYAVVMDGYRELGFEGGMGVPVVLSYSYGFIAGAEYAAEELGLADGSINIKYHLANTFSMDYSEQLLMTQWYNSGTEIIFAVAGELNQSVMIAAEDSFGLVIGADYDQSILSDVFFTSVMKYFGNVVAYMLWTYYENDSSWDESLGGQETMFGAANDAIGLPLDEGWNFQTFTQEEYLDIYADIADGTLVIEKHDDFWITPKVIVEVIG